jgi:threonine/homoserine/homoserine lactone efflux protein
MALKLAGGAYLVFLGVQGLLGKPSRLVDKEATIEKLDPRLPAAAALRQGLLSNLGNPKMLAFFTSVLPQFASSASGSFVLGLLFFWLTLMWLSAYSFVVARAIALIRRPRVQRSVKAMTGMVLIAFGARLAVERLKAPG